MTYAKNGLEMSGAMIPNVLVLLSRRPRAIWLGRYFRFRAASRIAASVSRLIRYFEAFLFSTRDTVDTDTPACSAMSFSVTAMMRWAMQGECVRRDFYIRDFPRENKRLRLS